MKNQAQTLLDQRMHRHQLTALAKAAAVKVFASNPEFDDATKYQFEDGSELVVSDFSAYVVEK